MRSDGRIHRQAGPTSSVLNRSKHSSLIRRGRARQVNTFFGVLSRLLWIGLRLETLIKSQCIARSVHAKSGAIAQLGERVVRNDEAVGSIPTSSTKFSITYGPSVVQSCPTLSQKIRLAAEVLPQPSRSGCTATNETTRCRRANERRQRQSEKVGHGLPNLPG